MKALDQYIKEYLIDNNTNYYNYHPKTKEELKDIIKQLIKERVSECFTEGKREKIFCTCNVVFQI